MLSTGKNFLANFSKQELREVGNSKRCMKWGGILSKTTQKGGGGGRVGVKPDIVCRWGRVFKNESLPLPHARAPKNCNHVPSMLIRLCLMNGASGAKL